MAGETDDPETAAERLEVALERIALAATRGDGAAAEPVQAGQSEEFAARLDELIDRLRAALSGGGD
jgi:hypothetical protein